MEYYVKTDGNDANNGQSIETAWQHPSYAAQQATAGDTIYLMDGTWNGENVSFTNSGTEGSPITMTAYNGTPTLDGGGVNITHAPGHITIEGLTIRNGGINVRDSSDNEITNIHILNCDIGLCSTAIHFSGVSYSSIENCNLHDSSWNTVQIAARYSGNECHHILIKNCKIHDSPGASGGEGHNLIDLFNYMSGTGGVHHIDIIGNELYNDNKSISCSGVFEHRNPQEGEIHHINIRNNIIYTLCWGLRLNANDSMVANNVVYNCGHGMLALYYGSVTIKNNIVINNECGIWESSSGADYTLSYNNVWGNGTNWHGCSQGPGSKSVDPLFIDAANKDFHLKSQYGRWTGSDWVNDAESSPCIDAGDPSDDYSNEPAPNGGRINMGAYGNTMQASKSWFEECPQPKSLFTHNANPCI